VQKEEKASQNSLGPQTQTTETQKVPSGNGYSNAPNAQTNLQGFESNKDLGTNQPAQKQEALEPQPVENRSKKKSVKTEISMDKKALKPESSPEPSNEVLAEKPVPGTAFSGSTTVNQTEIAGAAPQPEQLSSTSVVSDQANLPPASTPTPLSSWAGSYNPSSSELQQLISDAETFQKFWQTYQLDKPVPTVDFSTQAVVMLIDQERPTSGYSIGVSSLEDKPDQLVIHYKTQSPAPGSFNAQVLTRPWSLRVIPKPSKPVVFLKD
jgi:hypothetical protein